MLDGTDTKRANLEGDLFEILSTMEGTAHGIQSHLSTIDNIMQRVDSDYGMAPIQGHGCCEEEEIKSFSKRLKELNDNYVAIKESVEGVLQGLEKNF